MKNKLKMMMLQKASTIYLSVVMLTLLAFYPTARELKARESRDLCNELKYTYVYLRRIISLYIAPRTNPIRRRGKRGCWEWDGYCTRKLVI